MPVLKKLKKKKKKSYWVREISRFCSFNHHPWGDNYYLNFSSGERVIQKSPCSVTLVVSDCKDLIASFLNIKVQVLFVPDCLLTFCIIQFFFFLYPNAFPHSPFPFPYNLQTTILIYIMCMFGFVCVLTCIFLFTSC